MRTVTILFLLCALPEIAESAERTDSTDGATETMVVSISVNEESFGDFFVERDQAGNIFLKREDLTKLRLRIPSTGGTVIRSEEYHPLSAVEGIRYELDEKTLSLAIKGLAGAVEKTVIDFTSDQRRTAYVPKESSAFLNYAFSYYQILPDYSPTFTIANKLGAQLGDILFLTDTLFTIHDEEESFVRLMSNFTHEERATRRRWTIGDMFASSGELGGTVNIGGLGLSKVYQMDPYFIRQPMFSTAGATAMPVNADVYLDGMLVRTERLAPGPFEINNLAYSSGSHNVEVVLRDPFGKEQRLSYVGYFSDALLKPGLHEYSYNAGFMRENFGVDSNLYGLPVFSMFHRFGVSRFQTIGGRAEAGMGLLNLGVQDRFVVPILGTFALDLAGSWTVDDSGGAAALTYTYVYNRFGVRYYNRVFSEHYANFDTVAGLDNAQYKGAVTTSYSFNDWGAMDLGASGFRTFGGRNQGMVSMGYSKNFLQESNVSLRTQLSGDSRVDFSVFLTYTYQPGKNEQFFMNYSQARESDSEMIQYQKLPPVGEGTGYRATVQRQNQQGQEIISLAPRVQVNAPYGIYSADVNSQFTDKPTSTTAVFSAAGSLAYAGGNFGFSRPITDSFAFVMVDRLPDVEVKANNEPIGSTDSSGKMIVPNMASYADNLIAVDPGNIPMDMTVSGLNTSVSPSPWSGFCVGVDVSKVQAITGRVLLKNGDKAEPVELRDAMVRIGDREVSFPIGRGGEFYLENNIPSPAGTSSEAAEDPQSCSAIRKRRAAGGNIIAPGVYPAAIDYIDQKCSFNITFPKTEDFLTDVGELQCTLVPNKD